MLWEQLFLDRLCQDLV